MNRDRPTLADLRTYSQKPRHRDVGNWLARRVGRPLAIYGTWLVVRLNISAHQVTLLALCASLLSALAIGTGTRSGFVSGVILGHLAFWLDHVDGQVARWRQSVSLSGVYFDYMMHHAAALALGFGLGYGLLIQTGDHRWTLAGFAIALGWAFLSLQNDCRYKAFFAKLKEVGPTYRVIGGSGGQHAPAPGWPRRGRAALTWPAYKICEPHVVLLALTVLAPLAIVAPSLWLKAWQYGVLAMAILAPTLAIGRAAKAVRSGSVDAEFRTWFEPES